MNQILVFIKYYLFFQPNSTLVNTLCQVVTCYTGDNYKEGPVQCVPHSKCLEQDDEYVCICDIGFEGDGYERCGGKKTHIYICVNRVRVVRGIFLIDISLLK